MTTSKGIGTNQTHQEILNEGKINLFLDVDDTIIKSSEAIISILNEKYQMAKKIEDLNDWNYCSIKKELSSKEVTEMYSSDEFFNKVQFFPVFLRFFENYKNAFNFIFVTKGTNANLEKKQKFLENKLGKDSFKFEGLLDVDGYISENKSKVDMKYGIHIDDVTKYLEETNANIKILIKNYGKTFNWGKNENPIDNLYVAENGWSDTIKILDFFAKNKEFIRY